MGVSAIWEKLDTAKIYHHVASVGKTIRDLMHSLNALYECTFDAICPGGSSQSVAGHDHADEGGGPLICNSQFTIGGPGTNTAGQGVINASPTPGDPPSAFWLGYFYISPHLGQSDLKAVVDVEIRYAANSADFLVWFNGGKKVELKRTEGLGTSVGWAHLQIPITRDKTWEELYCYVEASVGDGGLSIFSINGIETYERAQPQNIGKLGSRDISGGIASGASVLKYFDVLDDETAESLEWLDAYLTKTLYSAINFLAEGVQNRAAPGASAQTVKGHDHYPAGFGGRPIQRGKIFSCYWGDTNYWTYANCSIPFYTYYADTDNAIRRTTTGPVASAVNTGSSTPLFKAWVDEGISSSGNPPSSAPVLDAWVKVSWVGTPGTIIIFLYNQTTSTRSDYVSPSSSGSWVRVTNIPCSGGAWNDFDIQVGTVNGSTEVYLHGIILTEAYEYSDSKLAYVASAGARLLGSVLSGLLKSPVNP